MIALSCGPTIKKPEPKNTSTSIIIRNLTIAKLLRRASERAWDPASTGVGAWESKSVRGVRRLAIRQGSALNLALFAEQVRRNAAEQIERRCVLVENQYRTFFKRTF